VQGLVQPFKYPRDRRLEYFNQAILFVWCYYMYIFTDFVPDAAARYTMGYHLIALISFCILVNLTVINIGLPYRIKKKFFKSCLGKKLKKKWAESNYKKAAQALVDKAKKRLEPDPQPPHDQTCSNAGLLLNNSYPVRMDINERP
jgi:hypothetical protein